jgi:hypothetical protein
MSFILTLLFCSVRFLSAWLRVQNDNSIVNHIGVLKNVLGLKVFMDAHNTVTVEEGDRYPLRPPNFIPVDPSMDKGVTVNHCLSWFDSNYRSQIYPFSLPT